MSIKKGSGKMSNVVYFFEEYVNQQNEKGLAKYGQPLDPFDGRYDFLKMSMEEKTDDIQYTYAEMIKRKHVTEQIRCIIRHDVPPRVHDQITTLLDQLEGKH